MYGTKETDFIDRSAALAEKLHYALWPRPVHVPAVSVLVFSHGYRANQGKVEIHIRSQLIKVLQMDECWFTSTFNLEEAQHPGTYLVFLLEQEKQLGCRSIPTTICQVQH